MTAHQIHSYKTVEDNAGSLTHSWGCTATANPLAFTAVIVVVFSSADNYPLF